MCIRDSPEIKAVQNRYKGKTDQASMAKQQVEMQAVYEKYGSNPMAGCLPMAIQLPIIFALYRVIYNIPAYVPSVRVFFDNVATVSYTHLDVYKRQHLHREVRLIPYIRHRRTCRLHAGS